MNSKSIGAVMVITASVALTLLMQIAYNDFMRYKTDIKYSCFGSCIGKPTSTELKYINFEKKQLENEKRKFRVEVERSKRIEL